MELEHVNNRILHYDGLIWTVTSILLAANSLLINALIQADVRWQKISISLLGLLLTVATVYFVASFRKFVHGYSDKYKKDANDVDDIKKIEDSSLKQWPFYTFMFWLIGGFWCLWPIFLSMDCSILSMLCFIAFIFVTIYFRWIHEKGKYVKISFNEKGK